MLFAGGCCATGLVCPQPLLDLAEYALAAIVDGDDVSRAFGPDESFFFRSELLEREFRDGGGDARVFPRLHYQRRGSHSGKSFPCAIHHSRQLEKRPSRHGAISEAFLALDWIVNRARIPPVQFSSQSPPKPVRCRGDTEQPRHAQIRCDKNQ